MELVPVTTVDDVGLANVVRGILEQEGIDTAVSHAGSEDVFVTPEVSPLVILVPAADAERARDVLAQYETTPDEEEYER